MKPIRTHLNYLRLQGDAAAVAKHSYGGLTDAEKAAFRAKDCVVYQGKVRELVRRGKELYIVHTDRLSAFDRHVGMVPYKGTILAAISEFWFHESAQLMATHYASTPHERVLKVESLEPVRAEVIVRAYLAGTMMRAYQKGERTFCGVHLPEGLKPFGKLPELMLTPTTKAAAYQHDENATPKELIDCGVVNHSDWKTIETMALNLFRHGQKVYAEKGWILVDTKYEFGRDRNGKIKLIDEVHTPDSSRLWVAKSYAARLAQGQEPEMFDKENVRRFLLSKGFSGEGEVPKVPAELLVDLALTYLDVAEGLLGKELLTVGPLESCPDLKI